MCWPFFLEVTTLMEFMDWVQYVLFILLLLNLIRYILSPFCPNSYHYFSKQVSKCSCDSTFSPCLQESACQIVKSVGDNNILQRIASEGLSFAKKTKSSRKQTQRNSLQPEVNAYGNERKQTQLNLLNPEYWLLYLISCLLCLVLFSCMQSIDKI